MRSYPFVICDVFTEQALTGNQLAVFPASSEVPDRLMGALAREINFSETVFAGAPARGGDVRVRIFTPVTELPFAGHPTLGSAAVLAEGRNRVVLETGAGEVPVDLRATGEGQWRGSMAQPLPSVEPFPGSEALFAALGAQRSRLPVEVYDNGVRHAYVALEDEDAVSGVRPDLGRLAEVAGATGVSCFAGAGTRWKTRMFGPGVGVAEDAATGSAAGPLAVHLCRHGDAAFGEELTISQGSEMGRPSTLYATARGSPERLESVAVGGGVMFVGSGQFRI